MKQPFLFKIFLCLFSVVITAQSKSIDSISNISKAIFNANKQAFLDLPEYTEIAIAVLNKDEVNYLGITKTRESVVIIDNRSHVFEIGSISKVFTSILFSHFIHNKIVSLDDSLEQHLGYNLARGNGITLKHLSNHTSGLPRLPSNGLLLMSLNKDNPYKYYSPQLLNTYLKEAISLQNPIGEIHSYSNLGTGILGYVLTLKAEKSYEELLQHTVFQPLKMNSSSTIIPNTSETVLVKGRDEMGNICSNWEFTDALVGAGGIKSNVADMILFLRKNLTNDPVYALTHKPTFKIKANLSMGLGWFISQKDNNTIYWHNGATGGYRSCITLNKAKNQGVVVLSNLSPKLAQNKIVDKIAFQSLKLIGK